eukprot:14797353-Alexandrium_andersonii.AAC.1
MRSAATPRARGPERCTGPPSTARLLHACTGRFPSSWPSRCAQTACARAACLIPIPDAGAWIGVRRHAVMPSAEMDWPQQSALEAA